VSDSRLTVGVAFGGVAPEHEVSIISALQAAAALDRSRYRPLPIYIAKDGTWFTGEGLLDIETYRDQDALREHAMPVSAAPGGPGQLELVEVRPKGTVRRLFTRPRRHTVDVMLLGLHGGTGENGGLQGLCETMGVPYTGSGVLGSALGMDKAVSKMVCRDQDIPVVDFVAFHESTWGGSEEEALDYCAQKLGYPMIVKPAQLGSSIGIELVEERDALDAAIEDGFRYDEKVIVERAVEELREINCAVLGDVTEATPSVLEEPVASEDEEVLSFQDKYMREEGGGAKSDGTTGAKAAGDAPGGMASLDRIIPAELSEERTEHIQNMAVRIFQLFDCAGVARIDFMIDEATGDLFFNEINTIPGSFSFYLWEPTGIPFEELTHRMIEIARRRFREQRGRIRTYDVNLLAERSLQGLTGAKRGQE
jgi:D-alanine-D-alanine ligase